MTVTDNDNDGETQMRMKEEEEEGGGVPRKTRTPHIDVGNNNDSINDISPNRGRRTRGVLICFVIELPLYSRIARRQGIKPGYLSQGIPSVFVVRVPRPGYLSQGTQARVPKPGYLSQGIPRVLVVRVPNPGYARRQGT